MAKVRAVIFWIVMYCSLAGGFQHLRKMYHLHLQCIWDGDNKFLQNLGTYLQDYHNPEGHKAKTLPNLKQSSPYEARAHDTKQARHQDLTLGHAMGQV
jgi:hypothetical protein